jgi:hypothetical protein
MCTGDVAIAQLWWFILLEAEDKYDTHFEWLDPIA